MTEPYRHFPAMQCFVLMPFGSRDEYAKGRSEADFVYKKIIKPAVQKALSIDDDQQGAIVREVDNNEPGVITKAVIQRLAEAPIAIVDITGHNGNVFFEMGVRYSLVKSTTILIRQPHVQMPFDIANLRCHIYELLADDASDKLADAIRSTIVAGTPRTDSPVYEVFSSLEVATNEASEKKMPWNEYQDRIDKIRSHILAAYARNTYCPDAIIGITKGGAAFADLLTQKMPKFRGATLALWADREGNGIAFFDNPINKQLLHGFSEFFAKDPKELRLLLVDEVVASGGTYKQAVKLIRDLLPECHLRFLPMVYKENHNYELVADRILWKHHAFNFTHDEINDLHLTRWGSLPWGKDIRRA